MATLQDAYKSLLTRFETASEEENFEERDRLSYLMVEINTNFEIYYLALDNNDLTEASARLARIIAILNGEGISADTPALPGFPSTRYFYKSFTGAEKAWIAFTESLGASGSDWQYNGVEALATVNGEKKETQRILSGETKDGFYCEVFEACVVSGSCSLKET